MNEKKKCCDAKAKGNAAEKPKVPGMARELPQETVQRIEIDDEECIRCYSCCSSGCAGAPSIFREPGEAGGVPELRPRTEWNEPELLDAVFGCPTSAISARYETCRLTADGIVSLMKQSP